MRELILNNEELLGIASEILRNSGVFRFKARGWSMRPFLRQDDILTITPVDPASLKPGDICLFRNGHNHIVAHRFVRRKTQNDDIFLHFRSDSMIKNEDFILENQLLGMVVEAQRGKKVIRLTSRLYKVLGLLWMKTMPVSNYLYVFIVSLARSFK